MAEARGVEAMATRRREESGTSILREGRKRGKVTVESEKRSTEIETFASTRIRGLFEPLPISSGTFVAEWCHAARVDQGGERREERKGAVGRAEFVLIRFLTL